jgi:hypothetical protein
MASKSMFRVGYCPIGPAPLKGPAVRLVRDGSLMPSGNSLMSVPQIEGSQGNVPLTVFS